MDCLRASEIVSAAHDGEVVEVGALVRAREHCKLCAECRAFATTLARVEAVPAPRAPEELVARIIETRRVAAEEVASEPVAPAPVHTRLQWIRRPTLLTYVSAAAVLLIALTAGSIALLGSNRGQQTAFDMSDPTPELSGTMAESQEGDGSEAAPATPEKTPMDAPPYVAFGGGVWRLVDAAQPAPSTLTTAGVVSSALGTSGAASERTSYFASGDAFTLYVMRDDGSYAVFDRVVRYLGRSPYGLVSDAQITLYGQWPQLPADFAPPQEADGSPTFRLVGFDDLNVDVYLPAVGRLEDGFAVAPGTGVDDPAADNPGWTWWERLP